VDSAQALIIIALRAKAVENAVDHLQPKAVTVVTSQESLEEIIVGCSGLRQTGVNFKYQPLDEAMEIAESFKRFDRVLAQFQRAGYSNREILLDATGGTTPLRVGAALAAMMRNVKIVHQRVRRDRYTGGGWHNYTSEDIELLPMGNPLEDTGLLREGQAVNLFNMRDYSAAALVFEDVLEKVVGVERYHYYGGLVRLAKGYGAWEMADYAAALEHLSASRKELSVDFEDPALADRSSALLNRLGENQPFLGKLWHKGKSEFSVQKVVDMVENARRRILDQGRYDDDGVARLYRSVEMWHQWRLLDRYSIETETVKWGRVDEDVQERFLDLVQTKELPEGLGLRHARILDHLLSGKDPEEDDAAFQKLLSARTSSILAHGVYPIGQRTAEKFLQYLDTLMTVPDELRSGAMHAELLAL
jgi:CRISPR-associated protein (TIGR02710 family)